MTFHHSLLAATLATLLTACGGSESPNSVSETTEPVPAADPAPAPSTSASSTATQGVITGFGSVYVNGKRYVSDSASFTIEGKTGAQEAGLKMGMVVKIKATEGAEGQDPEATKIVYEETLQGFISLIDYASAQLTIMGQAVYFDDLTEFESVDPAQLSVGSLVEISGYITETGFYATYIELETDEKDIKLSGPVSQLNTEQQTFLLSELTVNYSEASFDDMTADDLSNGMVVKVEGTTYNTDTRTLTATEIENKEPDLERDFEDADEIEIAGMLTNYDSEAGTFKVNQYTFILDQETEFDNGSKESFTGNVWVKVEGSRDGDALVAETIEFKERKNYGKSEGQVASIDSEAETFVVNGITFHADLDTQYEDESEQDERRFTFDDIQVNDILKVTSRELQDGNVIALKVKRINEEDREGEVKGAPTDISLEGMTVAGVAVLFDENTEFETDDGSITADEFMNLVAGDATIRVEVEGKYSENALIATDVEVHSESTGNEDEDEPTSRKVEMEGLIEAINDNSVLVAGSELRFDHNSKLTLNDEEVSGEVFLSTVSAGDSIEFTGVWIEEAYILVFEAEVETE
ncbi:DUF5666 domain-containing protein [Alteromonas sp. ASW11-130]|uniref:DUF5666 domain-containing protein n=1 Tax=Alteromonas sp. ASW11-130 TaxID=3015775 RepID=UPI0022419C17|nr:DUF5666 domain-containing protein [Alteromonas sp. ASW11-130]MCW8093290.1 DUF5666 domain-containing protein [Alteromonas sp. ASW11-130]